MTLDAAIIPMLSGVADMGTNSGSGRRPIGGMVPQDRLQAVLALIGDTVLPRSHAFFADAAPVAAITVASGRVLKLTMAPVAADASGTEADTRDAKLASVGRSLAKIAQAGGNLTVETNYVADELAAEDVGQTATELREFCSRQNWFADGPDDDDDSGDGAYVDRAAKLTLAQTVLGLDAGIAGSSGKSDLILGAETAAPLVAEIVALQGEVTELAGMPCMIVLRGLTGKNAVSIALSGEQIVVAACEDDKVAGLSRLWMASRNDEESAK